MMFLTRYAPTLAALAGVAGLVWYVMDLRSDNAALTAENSALSAQIEGCEARVNGNLQHRDRANEIDALSDDDLRDRAIEWMRP